jgi:hypothetical protein
MDAQQAMVRDGVLYWVSPDAPSVRAAPVHSQTLLWNTPIRAQAPGHAELSIYSADTVLVHSANELLALDRSSGVVRARHSVVAHSGARRSHIQHSNGACALQSDCAIEPIDCQQGTPLGPVIRGPEITFFDDDMSDSQPSCLMHQREAVGLAGQRALYVISANALVSPRAEGTYLVARDLRTGTTAYQQLLTSHSVGYSVSALSTDRSMLLYGYPGPDQRVHVVAVRANDGRIAWQNTAVFAETSLQPMALATVNGDPSTMAIVARHGQSNVYYSQQISLGDGRARWSVSAPAGVLPLGQQWQLPEAFLRTTAQLQRVSWRDVQTGIETTQLPVHEGMALRSVASGGYATTDEAPGYDSNGALIPYLPEPAVFAVQRSSGGLATRSAQVFVRQSAAVVESLSPDAWWLGESRADGRAWVAVFHWREQTFGRVVRYSVRLAP